MGIGRIESDGGKRLRSRYPRWLLLLRFNTPNHQHSFINNHSWKEGFTYRNLSYAFSEMSLHAAALKVSKRRAPNFGLCLPSLTDQKAKSSSHPFNDDDIQDHAVDPYSIEEILARFGLPFAFT
jgi:hypothetical protein